MQTPISLSSSVLAAMCSSVLTLTLYFGCATVAPTVRVPSLSRYGRPGSIGSSFIQTMWASNWSATAGGDAGGGEHVAAADVDLVGEGEGDRLAGRGLGRGRRRR